MKTTVEIEKIRAAQEVLAEFNRLDLKDVELTENGVPIQISPEHLEEWRFVGMTNCTFVALEFWKDNLEPVTE